MRKAYICLPSWLDTNATFYWIYYTEWGTFQYYLFSLPLIFCMSAGGYLQEIIRINWATNRVLFDHSCFIIIIIFNYYYYSINLEKKERKTESKISGPSFVGENYDSQSQVHTGGKYASDEWIGKFRSVCSFLFPFRIWGKGTKGDFKHLKNEEKTLLAVLMPTKLINSV